MKDVCDTVMQLKPEPPDAKLKSHHRSSSEVCHHCNRPIPGFTKPQFQHGNSNISVQCPDFQCMHVVVGKELQLASTAGTPEK